jgi:very-long-chain (3R)-3-hydroxyacyl-CoA dehydratase
VYKKLQKDELGYITESKRKIYLFCYNLFMTCGFLYVVAILNLKWAKMGDDFFPVCYRVVGNSVKMLHLFMILEVLHPIFGYTKVNEDYK